MALASGRPSPRYKHLKPILETGQDLAAGARPGDDGGPGDDEAGLRARRGLLREA